MSKNIEIEKRVMLTKEQYDSLFHYASKYEYQKLDLINHYFDDENLALRNAHYMLRIRNINAKDYELTLKIKGENGDLEINEPINKKEVKSLIDKCELKDGEIKNQILKVTSKDIRYITSLETERIEIKFDNYLFVLDKNKYSDITDYNLEIEASDIDVANEVIKKYCTEFNVQYSREYKSKSRRAINYALGI